MLYDEAEEAAEGILDLGMVQGMDLGMAQEMDLVSMDDTGMRVLGKDPANTVDIEYVAQVMVLLNTAGTVPVVPVMVLVNGAGTVPWGLAIQHVNERGSL